MIAHLVGTDGNVFALLGKTARYLKNAGRKDLAESVITAVFATHSYDESLALMVKYLEEAGYTVN